jgi:glutamine cyclotransferase
MTNPLKVRAARVAMLLASGAAVTVIAVIAGQDRPSEVGPGRTAAPVYTFEVARAFAHDAGAFTQGLLFHDGMLYESTGLQGRSSLRKVDLESGRVLALSPLEPEHFGEGLARAGDRLIQLTWKSRKAFEYGVDRLDRLRTLDYPREGWGITGDGERLIASDGSAQLLLLDPRTLAVTGRVPVRDGDAPVERLNELEYVRGEIFANVWLTDYIARIDPATGRVTGWIDLTGLLDPRERGDGSAVLNGIAYDAEQDRLFVTGKLWPKLFEIRLVAVSNASPRAP